MARQPGQPEAYMKIGSDGIAISKDRETLFYCPLAGRHLYSVSVDALADRNKSDQDVAGTVKDLCDRGYSSGGLETGPDGSIYLTDYEHNAIHVRDGPREKHRDHVADPRGSGREERPHARGHCRLRPPDRRVDGRRRQLHLAQVRSVPLERSGQLHQRPLPIGVAHAPHVPERRALRERDLL